VTLGFHREVDENRALLGYYAASSGNLLPTFGTTYRSHPQGSRSQKKFILNSVFGLQSIR